MGADQRFFYTCSGAEAGGGTDFFITLPAARDTATYFVTVELASVTRIFGFDLPSGDRSTTQFRIVTTAAVQVGDVLDCFVQDENAFMSRGQALAMHMGFDMP